MGDQRGGLLRQRQTRVSQVSSWDGTGKGPGARGPDLSEGLQETQWPRQQG